MQFRFKKKNCHLKLMVTQIWRFRSSMLQKTLEKTGEHIPAQCVPYWFKDLEYLYAPPRQ